MTSAGLDRQSDQESWSEPREWTVRGFLHHFVRIDETMKDRSFAFVLGAGASISSKIPLASKLARDWVEELYQYYGGSGAPESFEAWATGENLGIRGFSLDRAATFYSQVYDERFGDDPESGYAYLEDAMKSAEPNIGYSILAKILENTRHKVVITTNFDNLVADALSIYTDTFPLVCGHESLTSFVRSRLRRPLIAKIHRDLLLGPKSSVHGTSTLDERWARVLRNLLRDYTPIVIGYGGNDGSLMDFLDGLQPGDIQGGIYWCYHQPSGKPEERIRRLVGKHRGKLIPVVGFNEFMIQLGERLRYGTLADEIDQRAQKRVKSYRDQWEQCQRRLVRPTGDSQTEEAVKPVRQALAATVEREDSWWSWELKARQETNPDKQEAIYRQGLQQFPMSSELVCNFAIFMKDARKNYDEAERLYRRALELDPQNATITGNFAVFMAHNRRNYDEAEQLYRRALELDPKNAAIRSNFARLIVHSQRNQDEAEQLYRQALELDPENAAHTTNFAFFMENIRKDYHEAEQLYRRALELDPNDANCAGNLAAFLLGQRRIEEAQLYISSALALNKGEIRQVAGEVLFYLCLVSRMLGRSDTGGLSRLKYVLQKGFVRSQWSFAQVLAAAEERIPSEEMPFYRALGGAILDDGKLGDLERFERWRQLTPVFVDEPWDLP